MRGWCLVTARQEQVRGVKLCARNLRREPEAGWRTLRGQRLRLPAEKLERMP
mgnify:CR=1 FL=1